MKLLTFIAPQRKSWKTCGNAIPTRSRPTTPLEFAFWYFQNVWPVEPNL